MTVLVIHCTVTFIVTMLQFFDCRAELREYRHPKCHIRNASIVYCSLAAEFTAMAIFGYALLAFREEISLVDGLAALVIFWACYAALYVRVAGCVSQTLFDNYWRARDLGLSGV